MAFVLKRSATVPVRPAAFDGQVTIHVRPCTVDEYAALGQAPLMPSGSAAIDVVLGTLGKHVAGIEGLEVDSGEGVIVHVNSVAQVLSLCPAWILGELYDAVFTASRLTPAQLGNFVPQSSGAVSTAGSTAAIVDPED